MNRAGTSKERLEKCLTKQSYSYLTNEVKAKPIPKAQYQSAFGHNNRSIALTTQRKTTEWLIQSSKYTISPI